MTLKNVASIGQYEIMGQLGRGGMATVYQARQPGLDRFVALKILPADLAKTENFRLRFEREAKMIARLRHRNILTIIEDGRQDNFLYLVMEYVEGGTLQERLGWPQNLTYSTNIIMQVGDALAYAHQQGIIHRDIKPANILMAAEDWPLLSDFGLAKMVEDSLHLTAGGASVGTPHYMSPEQAQGQPADHRSDIYALGIVLYEAVTGQRPYPNENAVAIIFKQINEPVPPPRSLRSDLPEAVEQVILKAIAKPPEDRYQCMADFLTDLHEASPHGPINVLQGRTKSSPLKTETASVSQSTKPSLASLMPRKRKSRWGRVIFGLLIVITIGLSLFLFKDDLKPLVRPIINITSNQTVAETPLSLPTSTSRATSWSNSSNLEATETPLPPSPTVTASPLPLDTPTIAPVSPTSSAVVRPLLSVTPLPTPSVSPTQIQISAIDQAEMVFVPAGEFIMGSNTLGDDERPVHTVYLDDFWIDRYEVSNAQFDKFVTQTDYQTEAEKAGWGWVWRDSEWEEVNGADWRHPRGPGSQIENKMDHPVVLMSWYDAEVYCQWAEKQLPTEAQWEKAARGPHPDRGYAWGNIFDPAKANTNESAQGNTTPVGAFSPQGDSLYGAADLTGNVAEWVADWYSSDYYAQAPTSNPAGPDSGSYKILRGGSWLYDEVYGQTAFRHNIRPNYTYDFTGFRCTVLK